MTEKLKKHRQFWLVLLIVICIGIIVFGGINYMSNLRTNLTEEAIDNVLAVTHQQQQSFDNFIAADRERLHSHAEYFSQHTYNGPDALDELLGLFSDVKAVYAVACLDEGWLATSADYDYKYLDDATLATYRAFESSGVRSSYISIFSQDPMFGYYEKFQFSNGHNAVIQLSYAVERFTEAFSLSFYDGQGRAYVVNSDGNILLSSSDGDTDYENIFDIISDRADQADMDRFTRSLNSRESGYLTFTGQRGTYSQAIVCYRLVAYNNLLQRLGQSFVPQRVRAIYRE